MHGNALDRKYALALLKKHCYDTLNIGNFLPTNYTVTKGSRIKFRILHNASSTWNVIEPIIEILTQDQKYDTMLVLTDGSDLANRISQCLSIHSKYKIIGSSSNDYDVAMDKPDIFLIHNMFFKGDIGDLRSHSKFIVAVASHVNCERDNIDEFCNFVNTQTIGRYKPDYFLVDTLLHQYFRKNTPETTELVVMGNPKFDNMYKALQRQTSVPEWNKLHNKRVLCYCPDHGLYDYSQARTFTLDLFGRKIFSWAHSHKQYGLIFRPHPVLLQELVLHGIWNNEDVRYLQDAIQQTDNIVWDEHPTYNEAFAMCHAVLTDAHCGITCTALPIGKPIGALYRHAKDFHVHNEISSALYEIRNAKQLDDFLQMVANGEDPKKQERERVVRKSFLHFDGNNAKRIIDFINVKCC